MNNTRWSTIVGKDVEAKTSEEVIKLAGLDWKVAQSPVKFDTPHGTHVDGESLVNYRADNNFPLGIVGPGYHVLQNSQMFNFLDGVVGAMESMYTNAGSFKGGRRVYIQAKVPGYIHFDNGDDVGEKYLTFISSHDGSMGIRTLFTPVRIACQNTIVAALEHGSQMSTIRHTISMNENLQRAKATLNLVNAQVSLLENLSRKLTGQRFPDHQMVPYLEKIGMVSDDEKKSTRAQNVINEVLNRFHHGNGSDLKSAKGTAWGAYNAVLEYVDHYKGSNPDKRAESALIGWGAKVKSKALHLLAA